ncbi:uncharacterized protein PG998_010212 [Apiospora kogelbergensis]|uniref:uncharacterized protein n=1 Tax=Apiospora kogelbergensis TaxID=1337665 RepID=UPI00312E3DF8
MASRNLYSIISIKTTLAGFSCFPFTDFFGHVAVESQRPHVQLDVVEVVLGVVSRLPVRVHHRRALQALVWHHSQGGTLNNDKASVRLLLEGIVPDLLPKLGGKLLKRGNVAIFASDEDELGG